MPEDGRKQACHHATSMLDHGTYFPRCCCGWLGVPTLSRDRAEREVQAHVPPCTRPSAAAREQS